jgi:hypothetical protein
MQRVKVEARKIHFLRCVNNIKAIEPQRNAIMHFYVDLRRFAAKRLIFECPDHAAKPLCDVIQM